MPSATPFRRKTERPRRPADHESSFSFRSVCRGRDAAQTGLLAGRGCHPAAAWDSWRGAAVTASSMLGTTGEGPSFSPTERESIWRAALQRARGASRISPAGGTGTPSLTETIDLTRMAFDLGFDGVVTLPPYYFRKAGDEGVFAWFSEVINKGGPTGRRAAGLPLSRCGGHRFLAGTAERPQGRFPGAVRGHQGLVARARNSLRRWGNSSARPDRLQRHRLRLHAGAAEPGRRLHHRAGQPDLALAAADLRCVPGRK